MKISAYPSIAVVAILLSACSESPEQVALEQGKAIWEGTCAVCHAQGLAGSPPIGNKKMWAKRIEKGLPVLFEHAKNGFSGETGLMPPRGGNEDLTDHQVELAVKYMVSQSQ
ncbi:cytochrome c5 [Catenovulum agarivorans DS-2]|uniref:Cytochrome c5 n=1 Tax=Catenovulum agarivorans DS-2 TaxID=1328313 RepID=W7QGU9_9ALTE|nr:c-type cytochrome [Catenovulum agarivorans]EWH12164.1 cytochrome c5 [Catenovulum agarivorans DS-2]